ncbi:hypothetical protein [Vibrio vulnificus]|uniref:hypothetical protein n=1 Tax=Vibrio vulnificus TaxID=672 RepID=UPI0010294055|nr:hypothetical protein [Vibrio vulnificus]RZQ95021.1 hypothetical protein D8T25_22185 [Vibrio vulnificus]
MLSKKEWTISLLIPILLVVLTVLIEKVDWNSIKGDELYITSVSLSTNSPWDEVIGGWALKNFDTSFQEMYPDSSSSSKGGFLLYSNKRKSTEYMGSGVLNNEELWVSDVITADDNGRIGSLLHFTNNPLKRNDLGINLYHIFWQPSKGLVDAVREKDVDYFTSFVANHDVLKESVDSIWFHEPELLSDEAKIDGHIWHPLFGLVSGNPKLNIVVSNVGSNDATILGVRIRALKVKNTAIGCGAGGLPLVPINNDRLVSFSWYDKNKQYNWNIPIVLEPSDKTMIQVELGIGEISGSVCGPGELIFSLELKHNFGSGYEFKTVGQFKMAIEDSDLNIYWY